MCGCWLRFPCSHDYSPGRLADLKGPTWLYSSVMSGRDRRKAGSLASPTRAPTLCLHKGLRGFTPLTWKLGAQKDSVPAHQATPLWPFMTGHQMLHSTHLYCVLLVKAGTRPPRFNGVNIEEGQRICGHVLKPPYDIFFLKNKANSPSPLNFITYYLQLILNYLYK